jgi:hypothetical protein
MAEEMDSRIDRRNMASTAINSTKINAIVPVQIGKVHMEERVDVFPNPIKTTGESKYPISIPTTTTMNINQKRNVKNLSSNRNKEIRFIERYAPENPPIIAPNKGSPTNKRVPCSISLGEEPGIGPT